MGKRKSEEIGTVAVVLPEKKRSPALIIVVILLVIVTAAAIFFLFRQYKENANLEEKLTAAENEVARQEQLTIELEEHFNAQNAESKNEILRLQQKIDDFLNIQDTEPVITRKQIESYLETVSELTTKKYLYTNAEQSTSNKEWLFGWDLPFSEKSFIVKYDGIIRAGIDLNDIKIDVDDDNRVITVTLPSSKIIDHNVPQDKIEIFNVKDGFLNKVDQNESNEIITTGKEAMEEKASELGLLVEADREARTLMKAILTLMPGMDSYELIVK